MVQKKSSKTLATKKPISKSLSRLLSTVMPEKKEKSMGVISEERPEQKSKKNVTEIPEKKVEALSFTKKLQKKLKISKEQPAEKPIGKSAEKKEETETTTSSKKIAPSSLETDAPSLPVTATPIVPKNAFIKKRGYFDNFGLSKERDHFIENLSMLVLSGMPIVSALQSITRDTKSPKMKEVLETILLDMEGGSPLWKSFDKTGLFKGYTISLIRIGEESGKFAENLKVVSLQEEKDRGFKSKVKSALMYPAFVLVLTLVIGVGISWAILPKLAKVFTDLKLTLPLITRILMGFGLFLSKHGLWVVPLGAFVIISVIYVVFVFPRTKFLGEGILFSIPGIKTLLMEVEVARFGYLLGTLLEAGLQITRAIDSLATASEVIRYKKFYVYLRDSVDMGNSIQKSFMDYKKINNLIPQPIQQLVISGEQSGNLNKTLIKVGQVLEEKSDTTTKNLTIIMEPILLVIVWAGVVAVAFAVILPIYSLVGGINKI